MNTLNIVRNMRAELPSTSHYSLDEVIDFNQTSNQAFEPELCDDADILGKHRVNFINKSFAPMADEKNLHAIGKSLVSTKTGEPKFDILQKKSENEMEDWTCSMQKQFISDSNVPILGRFSHHSIIDDLVKVPTLSSWNSDCGNNLSDGVKSVVIENDGMNNHINELCEKAIEATEGTLNCSYQNRFNEFHEYEDDCGGEYTLDMLPNEGQHIEFLPGNLAESRAVWEDPAKNAF